MHSRPDSSRACSAWWRSIMKKSSSRGANISAAPEVLGLTPHALWLLLGDRELMLDFVRFPWFSKASMEDVCDVELLHGVHLHWPRLDIDLHIDSVEHPERFPLLSRPRATATRKHDRPGGTPSRRRVRHGSR